MSLVPSLLLELMVSTPAIVENCLISGVATEVAIISGDAPDKSADTLMVGNSARGKAATGKIFQAKSPPNKMASDIKIVATGRLMQNVEMFMAGFLLWFFSLFSSDLPPLRRRAWRWHQQPWRLDQLACRRQCEPQRHWQA